MYIMLFEDIEMAPKGRDVITKKLKHMEKICFNFFLILRRSWFISYRYTLVGIHIMCFLLLVLVIATILFI